MCLIYVVFASTVLKSWTCEPSMVSYCCTATMYFNRHYLLWMTVMVSWRLLFVKFSYSLRYINRFLSIISFKILYIRIADADFIWAQNFVFLVYAETLTVCMDTKCSVIITFYFLCYFVSSKFDR